MLKEKGLRLNFIRTDPVFPRGSDADPGQLHPDPRPKEKEDAAPRRNK